MIRKIQKHGLDFQKNSDKQHTYNFFKQNPAQKKFYHFVSILLQLTAYDPSAFSTQAIASQFSVLIRLLPPHHFSHSV